MPLGRGRGPIFKPNYHGFVQTTIPSYLALDGKGVIVFIWMLIQVFYNITVGDLLGVVLEDTPVGYRIIWLSTIGMWQSHCAMWLSDFAAMAE